MLAGDFIFYMWHMDFWVDRDTCQRFHSLRHYFLLYWEEAVANLPLNFYL